MEYHIDHNNQDPTIGKIKRAVGYGGKTVKLCTDNPGTLRSYWDGGSKNSYTAIDLRSGDKRSVDSNHPLYDKAKAPRFDKIPYGCVIVKHSVFCGKDMGITIYANEADISGLIPHIVELNRNEQTVVDYTCRYKNTYGGQTNLRYKEANRDTGITENEWNMAKSRCLDLGLIRKNGSVTPKGRNYRS